MKWLSIFITVLALSFVVYDNSRTVRNYIDPPPTTPVSFLDHDYNNDGTIKFDYNFGDNK